MKALVFDKELKLVDDYEKPIPQSGEALVRVTLAGICNTDNEITKGYMGYEGILGHEAVGIVEDVNIDPTPKSKISTLPQGEGFVLAIRFSWHSLWQHQ